MTPPRRPSRARRPGRPVVLAILALILVAAVAAAAWGAAGIGARLASGRPPWIALAAGFELVSALGFVVTFQLVFGEWLPRRTSLRTGLTVLAGTILIPAGGLVAIGVGVRALRARGLGGTTTGSRAIAFLLITNAPNLIVLGVLGVALGSGLLDGPHAPLLTIVPGAIALSVIGLIVLVPLLSHRRGAPRSRRIAQRLASAAAVRLELGVLEAAALLRRRSWKLLGAAAYYVADNAVLWATFKAFGHTDPPIATFAMAYLIGSSAGSLPIPGGIGVVEGGMIGALVLYGAPAACAGVAVLAYRAVSTGLPLALGGVGFLTLLEPPRRRSRSAHSGRRLLRLHPQHAGATDDRQ